MPSSEPSATFPLAAKRADALADLPLLGVTLPSPFLAVPEWALLLRALEPAPAPAAQAEIAAWLALPNLRHQALADLVSQERLPHLAADRLGEHPACPAPLREAWRAAARQFSMQAAVMILELHRVVAGLFQASIPVLVLKGPVSAILAYGAPTRRRFSDLDLVVRPEDLARTHQALLGLGYGLPPGQVAPTADPKLAKIIATTQEQSYVSRLLAIDLHWGLYRLPYLPAPLTAAVPAPWQTSLTLAKQPVPTLTPTAAFLHLACHAVNQGFIPLNSLADLIGMLHRHPNLDWRQLAADASASGTRRRLALALNLAILLGKLTLHAEALALCQWPGAAGDLRCALRSLLAHLQATDALARPEPWPFNRPAPRRWRALFCHLRICNLEDRWRWLALTRRLLTPRSTEGTGWQRLSAMLRRPFKLIHKYLSRAAPKT